jgi:hypothetical protein
MFGERQASGFEDQYPVLVSRILKEKVFGQNAGERPSAHYDHVEGTCIGARGPISTLQRFVKPVTCVPTENIPGKIRYLRRRTGHDVLQCSVSCGLPIAASVPYFREEERRIAESSDEVDLLRHEFACKHRQLFTLATRPQKLEADIASLFPAKFLHVALEEGRKSSIPSG